MTIAEQHLLELLVFDAELRENVLPILEETDYEALATAPVFKALINLHSNGSPVTLENMVENVDDEELTSDFIPLLMVGEPKRAEGEVIDEVLHDAENCIFTLRSMAISNRLLEISQELIAAELDQNSEVVVRLVQEHLDLSRMKQLLLNKISET
jgi:replicative DNA helicase